MSILHHPEKHLNWKAELDALNEQHRRALEAVKAEGEKLEPNWERYDRLKAKAADIGKELNKHRYSTEGFK
jgi:hypothetical protein